VAGRNWTLLCSGLSIVSDILLLLQREACVGGWHLDLSVGGLEKERKRVQHSEGVREMTAVATASSIGLASLVHHHHQESEEIRGGEGYRIGGGVSGDSVGLRRRKSLTFASMAPAEPLSRIPTVALREGIGFSLHLW